MRRRGYFGHLLKPVKRSHVIQLLSQVCVAQRKLAEKSKPQTKSLVKPPRLASEREPRAWRTLVIDDNLNNLEFTAILLEKLGYPCQTANDAEEAFTLIEDVNFDLILVDLMMPGMDGFELTKKIRTYERETNLPPVIIAAVSAGTENHMRQRAFQAGMF